MERKRKGYLLRKSVSFDSHRGGAQKEPQGPCICNHALSTNNSSRTYDLQTQTVTFGDEEDNSTPPKHHKRFSASSILKKFSSSSTAEEDNAANHKTKKQQKPFEMDSPDLEEFYPVDDHPSPSTFTAWDAFLSGTQAFFPASSSAYMDVIPEVEEEEEALLGSDTDDTGSSVSTVVDRFSSRNSTANSSFSERWKSGGGAVEVAVPHFDLEKVLSPFEKLEKELDAHQGSRDEDGRKKEIQRGPIVVITNSSSCEDVHSEEDDTVTNGQHASTNQDSNCVDNSTAKMNGTGTVPNENITQKNSDNSTKSLSKPKMVNGCKSEKPPARKCKSDTAIPIPPPPSNPKKKRSYPTPNIPPRMSLHVQARRTRSDPGTPDQPSRIPRPISSTSRSPVSAKKGTPKSTKSSKVNASKKQSNSDHNPKLVKDTQTAQPMEPPEVKVNSSGIVSEDHQVKQSVEAKPQEFGDASQETIDVPSELDIDRDLDEGLPHPDSFEIDPSWNTVPNGTNSFGVDPSWDSVPNGMNSFDDDDCWKSPSDGKDSNPFRTPSKTNPFTSDGEDIEVAKGSNPFENEAIPALQPKGQMTAAILAPPIPERPSLMKREKPVEALSNPENIANVLTPIINNQDISEEDETLLLPASLPPTKGLFSEPHLEKTKEEHRTAAAPNLEVATEELQSTAEAISFWPKVSVHQEVEIIDKFSAEKAEVDALFDNIESEASAQQQRPIEDILQALDQLVSAPREMEISIDWGAGEGVNIRETPLFSAASGDGSCCDEETTTTEVGGIAEDRRRCIESLLKEVDECLRTTHKEFVPHLEALSNARELATF